MLEQPLVLKIAASVAAASIIGLGANSFHVNSELATMAADVVHLKEIHSDLREIRDRQEHIMVDVAKLQVQTSAIYTATKAARE
jgi:hypothetical protein